MRSSPTSWKQPWKPYSSPSRAGDVAPAAAGGGVPVEDLGLHPIGPTQRANSSGSVWARISCAGVASKSRVMRIIGRVGVGLDRDLVAVAGGAHDAAPCWRFRSSGGLFVAAHLGQDGVEAVVALLGLLAVPLDPLRHQVEDLRFEMARPPLGVLALAHQARVGQHLDVLRHGLDGDVVRIGQLPDGGVAHGEAGHHVAPRRIGECGEDSGQLVVGHARPPCSTEWLNTGYATGSAVVNHLVEERRLGSPALGSAALVGTRSHESCPLPQVPSGSAQSWRTKMRSGLRSSRRVNTGLGQGGLHPRIDRGCQHG